MKISHKVLTEGLRGRKFLYLPQETKMAHLFWTRLLVDLLDRKSDLEACLIVPYALLTC